MPRDMLAQLHQKGRRIARRRMQRVPIAVAQLFGKQFQRLRMANRVARSRKRGSQCFGLRLKRRQ